MYAGGKTAVIAKEMRRYRISLLDLCETRWLQSGQVKLASGESILYSGHPEDSAPHTEGVGFMLFKEAPRAVISWEPVNSRIIMTKFYTTHKKINLQYSLIIFNSNVTSTLLYSLETWKTTTNKLNKQQTFINCCLCHLLGVYWPDTITNANLWDRTTQKRQ